MNKKHPPDAIRTGSQRRPVFPGGGRAVGLLLLAALMAFLLILADKPWENGVSARVAKGLDPRARDYAVDGLWYAGLANTLLLMALGATAGFWGREAGVEIVEISKPTPLKTTGAKIVWATLLLGALGLGFAERLPRMNHSLWNDEAYSLRRYVWGAFRTADNRRDSSARTAGGHDLVYREVSWIETLFFNRGANNHILFSALSKCALEGWRRISGAARTEFSETAFRMPSFIAGLLSVAALALLGAVNGAPWAGLGAAWLAAVHPWHIRYSTEGRGYALLLLFLTLAMVALALAVRRDRMRLWMAFAVCQTLFMLAFPGAVYNAAALALAAVAMIVWRRGFPGGGWTLARLAVAEIFSAMMFLQIYAPSIPQVRLYLEREISRGAMGWDWMRDIWAHLACALQWTAPGPEGSHRGMGLSDLAASSPPAFWFLVAALPALTLAGIYRAGRRRFEFGALATTGLVAPALAFAHNSLTGNFLFSWYLIFSLPILCLIWSCATLPVKAGMSRMTVLLNGTAGCLLVAAFLAATVKPRQLIREVPRQPMREAAEFVRNAAAHGGEPTLRAAVGTSAGQIAIYDPRAVVVESAPALLALLDETERKGARLFVYAAGMEKMRTSSPDLAAVLEDPARFKVAARLTGLEEMFSYTIFRHDSAKNGPGNMP